MDHEPGLNNRSTSMRRAFGLIGVGLGLFLGGVLAAETSGLASDRWTALPSMFLGLAVSPIVGVGSILMGRRWDRQSVPNSRQPRARR